MNKITEQIWIGDSQDAKNLEALKAEGITNILNVAEDLPPRLGWPDGIRHFHIGLVDGGGNDPMMYLSAALCLGSIVKNGKCLVHCHEGRSRSAFIIATHLSKSGQFNCVDQAIEFIKSVRPVVCVNEAHLRATGLIDTKIDNQEFE